MQSERNSRRRFLRNSVLASTGVALAGGAGTAAAQKPQRTGGAQVTLPDPTNRQGEYVEVNGARIFYQVAGQGAPMLLMHGYPLSGALFARNRDALAARYQVITIDHRGFGSSSAPGIPDSIAVYADDALAVMDQLGIGRAIVGGHSMGGQIMLEMYQRAPDRFRAMILIDTNAAAATPAEAGLERGTAEIVRQMGVDAIVPAFVAEMLRGETRLNQPELVGYLSVVMKQASVDAGIGGALALATRPDYMPLLGQIQTPALVFVGVADTLYPPEISMMMYEALPHAQLALISDGSHAAIFEVPDRSSEAILNWAAGIG